MVPRLLYSYTDGEVTHADTLDGIDDVPDVAPCIMCGTPASPYLETDAGRWCF